MPGFGCSIPLDHPETEAYCEPGWNWLKELKYLGKHLIENPSIIKVGWNLKFDNQIMEKYNIYYRGVAIDGMLAKYVLDEQRPNGLKDMVRRFLPEYGDYEKQDKFDKIPWDQKPLEELCRYGCQDTDYTLRLSIFFEKKLIDKGLYKYYRNFTMACSRVVTSLEKNGLYMDKGFNQELLETYKPKIDQANEIIYSLPKVKKFQKKLQEGRVQAYINALEEELEQLDENNPKDARKISSRQQKISNIKAGIFTTQKEKDLVRPLNLGSNLELPKLLYSEEGFNFEVIKQSDTGKPSTDEETLVKLRLTVKNPESPKAIFLDKLLELRGLQKMYTTYIEGWHEKVQDDSCLHGKYNIHGTDSQRWSSADPNLQQVPKTSVDPNIKKQLVAKPNKLYLVCDYSQCIDGESFIFTTEGIKRLKDIKPGIDKIYLTDPYGQHNAKPFNINVLANKGKAKCIKITTNTGRELILTEEHPVKSKDGYTLAKDLVPGSSLYIESFRESKGCGSIHIDSDEAYIAGLFYGDGFYPLTSCNKRTSKDRSISFSTGTDREELRPILENYFKCKFNDPLRKTRAIRGYSDVVKEFERKYPKFDSHKMYLPDIILRADWKSKMNFIAGQVDSDGSIGSGRFRYTSVCKEYISQLQVLFQSVGFHGIIRRSITKLNGKEFPAYHLIVQSTKALKRLKKYLRLKRKVRDCEECIEYKVGARPANLASHCPTQRIPLEIYQDLPRTEEFYKTYRNSLRKSRMINSTLKPYLKDLVKLDQKWLEVYKYKYELVESIEEVGEREVYDMEVDTVHEFSPNGIRVHNCELRVMAHLANDQTYLQAFAKGADPHLAIAAKKYGVPIEEATKIYEDEDHPDHKLWKNRRKQAKQIAFGLIYGIGPALLAVKLSDPKSGLVVTKEEAKKQMDEFFEEHPNLLKFKTKQERFLKKHGYLVSLFGAKRRLPEIFSGDREQEAYAIRLSLNFPVQSAAACMTAFGSVLIYWGMRQGKFPWMEEVATVHDALYWNTEPENINTWILHSFWDILRNPQTKKYFGFSIDDVDMDMDFSIGRSMAEELPFIPGYDYNKMLQPDFSVEEYMKEHEKYKHISIKEYPQYFKKEMKQYEQEFLNKIH
jgi:DNA polymerase I-like protein with 3'-5' exonuclease and polymerase domains/intein/homing endonuclease